MKKIVAIMLVVIFTMSAFTGCATKKNSDSFDGRQVRIVIGSTSTSGDTYMISDIANRYLAKALNMSSKIDAVGAGPAYEAIATAKPNGDTIMMMHDGAYLGVLFGSFEEKYALENYEIGPRYGVNAGAAFAAKADAPYNDMKEMADYLQANPDYKVRVAIESGSVSHLGFVVYYQWVKDTYGDAVAKQIIAVVGGTTSEKCQMLWDGNVDVIFADYSSLFTYTEEGVEDKIKMKYTALLDNIEGIDVPSFADLGITYKGEEFRFAKDFVIYFPKGTPQTLIDQMDKAVKEICENQEYVDAMNKLTYTVDYLSAAEAKEYIYNKRDLASDIITNAPSLDELTAQ